MSTGWDGNMLKKLKALVGKGLSTSEMGKKLGMSKNAVVGKLNRLGWNAKASDVASTKDDKKKTKTVAKKTIAKKVTEKAVTKTESKKATLSPKKTATKNVEKIVKTAPKDKTESKTTKTAGRKDAIVIEKTNTVVKTASKKTNKDLALHELLIQHALQMASLKPNQCRWPIGNPDSDNFHFCGETVFAGKPYCYEHCRQAYQFVPPKKK